MPQNEKNAKPIGGPGGRGGHGPRPNVKNPGKLFMRLLSYIMKNYAVHCVIVVICIFITVLASVQGTWFMQTLIDGYILPLMKQSDPDFSGLAHAILRVAVFYGIGAIAAYIYTRIMVNVSQGTLKHLRDDMFTHMEELPIRYFDTHSHGDIMSTYTNDIDTLRQMISQSMPQFLNSIISIVSVFISMLLLNIPLTLVTLVMVGVTLFATKKIGALSARYFIAQQKDIATVNGYIEEMMNGQKVVKVFTHEEESIADFNRLNDQLFHSADNANKFGNILMPVNAQIGNISYVLCAIVGGILALGGYGGFTLGKLASFLTYNKSFGQPINQLSMQLNNIVMALAGSERIFALLDEQPEVDDGYVTLVRARQENGQIVESKERTGMWAWKHTHQADGSVDYIGIADFNRLNDQLFHSADNANKFGNILMPVNAQIGNISYVLCAIVGGILALGGYGGFTLGKLASFLTYNKSFGQPINQLSMQLNNIVMALAGSERIFALLDEQPEVDDGYVTLVRARQENGQIVESKERTGMWAWKHTHQADGSVDYIELKGDVVFDDVDFGYVPEKTVLHNVDLYATPGQKIAFVGSTGAGKTTITNLINRFYDIQDGKIRYDGININKIKKDDLRHSLGIVLQDTHLFTATVMENIRYGKLDATDEEVMAAARLANADTFIQQLPNGYDTLLTGDGANLSQGQRQLLAIARAAIADPPVLILDEATSSIDTRTEKIVQDGMDKLMAGRTTFVIAHRLSTVRNSDCIIVLEQGRVIERGSHDQLIEKHGKYYQLYTGNLAEG